MVVLQAVFRDDLTLIGWPAYAIGAVISVVCRYTSKLVLKDLFLHALANS